MKNITIIIVSASLIIGSLLLMSKPRLQELTLTNTLTQFTGKFNTILRDTIPDSIRLTMDRYCSKPEECDTSNLPEFFDARKKWGRLITNALDQEKCGSCWAFATTTSISDRIRINSRVGTHSIHYQKGKINENGSMVGFKWNENVHERYSKIPLSKIIHYRRGNFVNINNISPFTFAGCDVCEIAQIVDNSVYEYLKKTNNSCNRCCDGGIIQYAMIYAMLKGCISVGDDPDPWSYDCSNWVGAVEYKVKDIYQLKSINDIKSNIMTWGPVVGGFKVKTYFGYDAGKIPGTDVFGDYGRIRGGHAIVICGWGKDKANNGNEVHYWLCRNSWGPKWNGDGYFKIQMGICGIEDDVWGCTPFQVYDQRRTTPKPKSLKKCNDNS